HDVGVHWQPQNLNRPKLELLRNQTFCCPATSVIIALNHHVQVRLGEAHTLDHPCRQRLRKHAWWQSVVCLPPAFPDVKEFFQGINALPCPLQLCSRHGPASDILIDGCGLLVQVAEGLTEELTPDEGVQHCREVLAFHSQAAPLDV